MAKQEDLPSTLDLIIIELGESGKYNILIYVLVFIPVLLSGIYSSAFVFIADDIGYRCQVPECESLNTTHWITWAVPSDSSAIEKCSRYSTNFVNTSNIEELDPLLCTKNRFKRNSTIPCKDYVYGEESSIVKEFNLGCQEWKRTLVGSIHNTGFFVSIALTGLFSDRLGRKTCLVATSVLNGIMGLIRSFSVNYEMFIIFEFLEATLGGGLYSSAFVLLIEIVSPKNRVMVNCIINVAFAIGLVILPLLAWVIQDWRITLRVIYSPAIFLVVYYVLLDESIRWLLVRGRHKEAIKIINKISKRNDAVISNELIVELEKKEREKEDIIKEVRVERLVNQTKKEKSLFMQVICSRMIMNWVVCCSLLWITITFTYYGLTINAVSISGNKYLNFMYVSLVEIPANISAMFMVDRFGRRKTLIFAFISTGLCCVSLAFIPDHLFVLSLILYLAGKFAISITYLTIYTYVSELFPTLLRQSLLGICSTVGNIGTLLAPQVPLMGYYMESLPSILFGLMASLSGVIIYFMPETTNNNLPDTIEEAEEISRYS